MAEEERSAVARRASGLEESLAAPLEDVQRLSRELAKKTSAAHAASKLKAQLAASAAREDELATEKAAASERARAAEAEAAKAKVLRQKAKAKADAEAAEKAEAKMMAEAAVGRAEAEAERARCAQKGVAQSAKEVALAAARTEHLERLVKEAVEREREAKEAAAAEVAESKLLSLKRPPSARGESGSAPRWRRLWSGPSWRRTASPRRRPSSSAS